mgnify:FL=1
MITKRNTLICDICGLFCKYYDEWTPYGCADPEEPEPYDPSHICKKCFPKVKANWIERFKKGYRSGDWHKSRAEVEAARTCGLAWSNGIGPLGTKDWANAHRYITQEEYDRLSKLPYWGYCKKCGMVRKGGYCSDKKCSESFKSLPNKEVGE